MVFRPLTWFLEIFKLSNAKFSKNISAALVTTSAASFWTIRMSGSNFIAFLIVRNGIDNPVTTFVETLRFPDGGGGRLRFRFLGPPPLPPVLSFVFCFFLFLFLLLLLLSPSPSSPSSPSPSSPSRPPPPAAVAAAVVVSKFFERSAFSFLRVADLEIHETMTTTVSSSATSSDEVVVAVENEQQQQQQQPSQEQSLDGYQPIDHIHHASVDPPPGVDHDPKERWIAFTTDKDGSHAPIAPIAMDRLAHFGLTTSLNQAMWTPADYKTSGLIKKGQQAAASGASAGGSHSHQECSWYASTFRPGPIKQCPALESNDVMIWSGSFIHGLYGSDLPAIRAAGIVNMSAKSLFDLLVDSTRVKEYNKLSLGRTDLVTFDGDLDTTGPFGRTITKVMRSETKPPMIRKTLVFESILHAKELVDGSGYLIVTRAIHQPGDDSSDHHHSLSSVIKSEILMGVNLIRKVEGQEDSRCLMINVNHIRSPMVPMMVAKRIGVSSAVGFMNDIRALC
mmetsp:Transcript_11682/g.27987  ORF Transcript_11682/g.27987 Transcript_11682/m.27987 type:complete len:507 (+) Transcript_11682:305-1825(+)